MQPLQEICRRLAEQARLAATELAQVTRGPKDRWLNDTADELLRRSAEVVDVNRLDLKQAREMGLSGATLDRLELTPRRIEAAAEGLRQVAALPDPVGEVREGSIRPNGLEVRKIAVPFGVIFFLYESRPNVTLDAAALCVKSGNAVILRGGKEAFHSNQFFQSLLTHTLHQNGLPEKAVQSVPTLNRDAVGILLGMNDCIDLAIPRGGESLIRRVAAEAKMPVLKHYLGNCHVYVDRSADLDMAERIIVNAKTQRPGVCNAMESLLVHAAVADTFIPRIGAALREKSVELRGCPTTCRLFSAVIPATEADYAAEFCDLIMSIKVVVDLGEAIAHINRYGSKHTDALITRDLAAARQFTQQVDSAAVLVNASTRFHDGFELGLGAEIGISTDKFHARGPCGLRELTTTKYVIFGDGHIRE